ncbi:hypothetical protein GDO78_000980 [Eleutherodactylus coqui]|uniref:Arf-GAP domain-containing protein n=1 Tax=Eleutherodactylus coqui TaxID=57060 RepID=A0A8J6FU70_ELECQ|nr:hypothetical protein GDO78_000980 [Eleutherodactylus coqui]
MTGKSVRDVERYQAVLSELLLREENKFCADCQAKGPRWASWNIGVFVCIRCAGVHRNLGVHISRVKSVNLDQWTQEQIQKERETKWKKSESAPEIKSEPVIFEKVKLPVSSMPITGSGSVPENLNLFPESSGKADEGTKKQLSKDSILSLYGSQTPQIPAQGALFMAPAQMPYPSAYTGFPAVPSPSGVMGGMMASPLGIMTQPAHPGVVAPMGVPAGYVGGMQAAVMGVPNGMMAQHAGYLTGMGAVAQPMYGMQPGQQLQWNVAQVSQQMAGMTFFGVGGMAGYGQPTANQGPNQTLSSPMWK